PISADFPPGNKGRVSEQPDSGLAFRSAALNAKTAPRKGTRLCQIRMAFRYSIHAKLNCSGTQNLIRSGGRCAMSASPSVLQAHRYRVVSESLIKPKFAIFFAAWRENSCLQPARENASTWCVRAGN